MFLPSGKQYLFHRDSSGRLQFVETMVLGHHHFRTLLTIGRLRHLYIAPGMTQPYITDYDTNGKLLQVLYPSQQRRVVFRYNHHFQVGDWPYLVARADRWKKSSASTGDSCY